MIKKNLQILYKALDTFHCYFYHRSHQLFFIILHKLTTMLYSVVTIFGLLLVNSLFASVIPITTGDNGPISEKIFENHPQLAYLGNFNGKFWYIVRTQSTYYESLLGCLNMGLTFATANQEEVNFLHNVTSQADGRSWLGADVPSRPSSFRWRDGTLVSGLRRYSIEDNLGLMLQSSGSIPLVAIRYTDEQGYYICTYQGGNPNPNELDVQHNHELYAKEVQRVEPEPVHLNSIFENISNLVFLGRFNNRSWYIVRTRVTQPQAISGCEGMGMVIAKVNQAELEFLYSSTTDDDSNSWLGGSIIALLSSFTWRVDNTEVSRMGYTFRPAYTLGLVLERNRDPGVLAVKTNLRNHYICTHIKRRCIHHQLPFFLSDLVSFFFCRSLLWDGFSYAISIFYDRIEWPYGQK